MSDINGISTFTLYAGAVPGHSENVHYRGRALCYERKSAFAESYKRVIRLTRETSAELCALLLACRTEAWSQSAASPPPLGRCIPAIKIVYKNGNKLSWEGAAPDNDPALRSLEAALSKALGFDFRLCCGGTASVTDESAAEALLLSLVAPAAPKKALCYAFGAVGVAVLAAGIVLNIAAPGAAGALFLCGCLICCLFTFPRTAQMRRCIAQLKKLGCVREAAVHLFDFSAHQGRVGLKNNPCVYTRDFLYVPSNGTLLKLSDIKECFVTNNEFGRIMTMKGVRIKTATVNVVTHSGMKAPLGAVNMDEFLRAVSRCSKELFVNGKRYEATEPVQK